VHRSGRFRTRKLELNKESQSGIVRNRAKIATAKIGTTVDVDTTIEDDLKKPEVKKMMREQKERSQFEAVEMGQEIANNITPDDDSTMDYRLNAPKAEGLAVDQPKIQLLKPHTPIHGAEVNEIKTMPMIRESEVNQQSNDGETTK